MSGGTRLVVALIAAMYVGSFVAVIVSGFGVWFSVGVFVGLPLFALAFVALVEWLDSRFPADK